MSGCGFLISSLRRFKKCKLEFPIMDNIVLGVEVGNGKYLVFTQEDQNTRLFVAFNQIGIGGHKEMAERLDMLTYGKKIEQEDLERFIRRA